MNQYEEKEYLKITKMLQKLQEADDEIDLASMQGFVSPFRYNPGITRRLFMKKAAAQPVTDGDECKTVFYMQMYDNCHAGQDVAFFAYAFFKYGNIQKVLKEAGDAPVFVSKKCTLYGISTQTRYPSQGHVNDMTLSRIARAFPVQAAEVILKENFPGILTFSSFFQQDLPLIMQHSIFSGLTLTKLFNSEMLDIAAILNLEMWVKLSKPEEKSKLINSTVVYEINRSRMYIQKFVQEYEQDEKLEILTKAGVLNKNARGEFELAGITAAMVNQLSIIKTVYSLKYSEAVKKLSYSSVPKLVLQ